MSLGESNYQAIRSALVHVMGSCRLGSREGKL